MKLFRVLFPMCGLLILNLAACQSNPPVARGMSSGDPNDRDNPGISNAPPCALPPLKRAQILEVARRAFGDGFVPPQEGLPPPNRRIQEAGCRYLYEQSIFYYDGKPASLDSIHASRSIYIARDGTYSDW